jgi:hypothetical protein
MESCAESHRHSMSGRANSVRDGVPFTYEGIHGILRAQPTFVTDLAFKFPLSMGLAGTL